MQKQHFRGLQERARSKMPNFSNSSSSFLFIWHAMKLAGGALRRQQITYNELMKKASAGLLVYRIRDNCLEILLAHPGGPLWQNRQKGAWSIPKGAIEHDEDAFLAAKREFAEETGFVPDGEFLPLGEIKQKSGKVVTAWAV